MISRRDNLLVRPWQQRRYENHRKKVELAGPAIDTRAPLPRQHVALKLKKAQKELERRQQIERNNFSLLKRLSYAMRTSRVDNIWTTPQPTFLNRVSMYDVVLPKFEDLRLGEEPQMDLTGGRKTRCLACTPHPVHELEIPEDRVPWEPQKKEVGSLRSRSVPARRPEAAPEKGRIKAPKSAPKLSETRKINKSVLGRATQSITLSRGCLKLNVNFPPDTMVKMQKGSHEKTLIQSVCNCRSIRGMC